MDFKYRVKVLGYSADQLLTMGFDVNTYDCQPGEHWAIASSGSHMRRLLHRNKIKPLTQPEAIR